MSRQPWVATAFKMIKTHVIALSKTHDVLIRATRSDLWLSFSYAFDPMALHQISQKDFIRDSSLFRFCSRRSEWSFLDHSEHRIPGHPVQSNEQMIFRSPVGIPTGWFSWVRFLEWLCSFEFPIESKHEFVYRVKKIGLRIQIFIWIIDDRIIDSNRWTDLWFSDMESTTTDQKEKPACTQKNHAFSSHHRR